MAYARYTSMLLKITKRHGISSVARFTSARSSRSYAKVSSTTSGAHARKSDAKQLQTIAMNVRDRWRQRRDRGAAVKNPRLVSAAHERVNNPPPDKAGPADD